MTVGVFLKVSDLRNGRGSPHRPCRAPYHTISHAGLVGDGRIPRPGEIALAHRGVLLLVELPEYNSQALETLRQPFEDRLLDTLHQASAHLRYPLDTSAN